MSEYGELVNGQWLDGVEIIQRVAMESSINERFVLAFLDFRSGWVTSKPADAEDSRYPFGFNVPGQTGLYRELLMVATHLNAGYYGWRDGSLTEMKFRDATLERLAPELNAGSIAIQYLFSKFYRREAWETALYGPENFLQEYTKMFGDPWQRAATLGPLLPQGLRQPDLVLPFQPGERWSFTGGPH